MWPERVSNLGPLALKSDPLINGLRYVAWCKNIVRKLIWKFTDIFPNQVLNFFNIFTEHGKITIKCFSEKN